MVAAIILGLFYRYLTFDLLLSDGENKNVAITRMLANSLWPKFSVLLGGDPDKPDRMMVEQLNRELLVQIKGIRVVKVKVYHPLGTTVFSTDMRQIGEDQSGNVAFQRALKGEISNLFVSRDEFNEFDRVVERRDLMQTYLPLFEPDGETIRGVFEVYSDYTPLLSRVHSLQLWVMFGTGATLLLLYGVLFLIVRHADQLIVAQQGELSQSLTKMEEIRKGLEHSVAERTRTLQLSNRLLEQEIQERLRMERVLREREQRLRAIMDNMLNAVVVVTDSGAIESMNSSAERLFGYDTNEIIGHALLKLIDQEKSPTNLLVCGDTPFAECMEKLLGEVYELSGTKKSGATFPMEFAVTRSDQQGQSRYVASFRDVSERKQAEQQLEEARQKFAHQEKMAAIGTLAAGIVHEIGNPVAAITGLIQDICYTDDQDHHLPEEVRANLDLVLEQVERMINITRDVSEFGNPQGGEYQLVDFNSLIGRTCRLMRHDKRLSAIEIKLELDPQLPAANVIGDQMIQVLMNLIGNAADAINACRERDGQIVVTSQLLDNRICMTVSDNGCGMDEKTAERAMEAFFTTKPMGQGTGLGLSLCHSIVSAHHGEISIRTESGLGTSIHVLLPADEISEIRAQI